MTVSTAADSMATSELLAMSVSAVVIVAGPLSTNCTCLAWTSSCPAVRVSGPVVRWTTAPSNSIYPTVCVLGPSTLMLVVAAETLPLPKLTESTLVAMVKASFAVALQLDATVSVRFCEDST